MTTLIGFGSHGRDIEHAFPDEIDRTYKDHSCAWHPEPYVLGMNNSRTRSEVAERLEKDGWEPHANGIVIMPNVWVGPDVKLGKHVHINFNAGLTRCTLGDFVTVGPGAVICGDVTIGARTQIGAGAVISNFVNIGEDVIVGAGAVVLHDVPDGATAVGVPARVL